MRIPYVIDNQQHLLADVLNEVLAEHSGRSLDVATAELRVRSTFQLTRFMPRPDFKK